MLQLSRTNNKYFRYLGLLAVTIVGVAGVIGSGGGGGGVGGVPGVIVLDLPRYAFVADRNDDSVSTYVVDAATGRLRFVGKVAAGDDPFSVTVEPSGKFAYVANRLDNTVSQYTIGTDGSLTQIAPAESTGTLFSSPARFNAARKTPSAAGLRQMFPMHTNKTETINRSLSTSRRRSFTILNRLLWRFHPHSLANVHHSQFAFHVGG